ncbi:MAG: hypothetical protein WC346_11840 [Methanogenium sp.]|jgi:hypothetical protein
MDDDCKILKSIAKSKALIKVMNNLIDTKIATIEDQLGVIIYLIVHKDTISTIREIANRMGICIVCVTAIFDHFIDIEVVSVDDVGHIILND